MELILYLTLLLTMPGQNYSCLPAGIKTSDVVSAKLVQSGASGEVVEKVTVGETLKSLKARCQKGKLVDRDGKEIYFYKLAGCWGNPPADYLEILEQQGKEIKKLKERYTVIELTCNPSAAQIP